MAFFEFTTDKIVKRLRWVMAGTILFDRLITLLGQPNTYWQHPETAVDLNRDLYSLLTRGPTFYCLDSLVGILMWFLIVTIIPRRMALFVIVFSTLGTFFGASTWLCYQFHLGNLGPLAYALALSAILVLLILPKRLLHELEAPGQSAHARTPPRPMKVILTVSLAIGLQLGLLAPFFSNLHVYRVTSGFSGKHLWLTFPSEPTEQAILDAVIYREPLIGERREVRPKDAFQFCMKTDAAAAVVLEPYDPTKDPDLAYGDGGGLKFVWLSEPATRTRFPVALVGTAYGVGAFLAGSIAAFCALTLARWLWYFLLRRISEMSEAVRHV